MPDLSFVFDQHVNGPALLALRARGLDVVHAGEAGLADADAAALLRSAIGDGRIVVTRNYRDYVPLAHALAARRENFPGVLLFPTSLPQGDAGAHVRAIEEWVDAARAGGANPVRGGWVWCG